jgi:hypothetical protein
LESLRSQNTLPGLEAMLAPSGFLIFHI